VSGTAICHHLPPSGLSGETARTPQHVRSQTNFTSNSSCLLVDASNRDVREVAKTREKEPLSRTLALSGLGAAKPTRARAAHILRRRFGESLLVDGPGASLAVRG
jgi:hypothetical protein